VLDLNCCQVVRDPLNDGFTIEIAATAKVSLKTAIVAKKFPSKDNLGLRLFKVCIPTDDFEEELGKIVSPSEIPYAHELGLFKRFTSVSDQCQTITFTLLCTLYLKVRSFDMLQGIYLLLN
jgi:hypothetical protein